MGKFPMQIQWRLLRTVRYWNKLVTDQARSELLNLTLQADVHFGLREGKPCWAKELLAGLRFVHPNQTGLKPIEAPKAVA
jgi:hypothetical protein